VIFYHAGGTLNSFHEDVYPLSNPRISGGSNCLIYYRLGALGVVNQSNTPGFELLQRISTGQTIKSLKLTLTHNCFAKTSSLRELRRVLARHLMRPVQGRNADRPH